jgi:hypothetical protein
VLYLIWQQPWLSVARDTYISRMLAAAGWDSCRSTARCATRRSICQRWPGKRIRYCCPANPTRFAKNTCASWQSNCRHTRRADRRRNGLLVRQPGDRGLAYLRRLRARLANSRALPRT